MTPVAVPSEQLDEWLPRVEWHFASFCRNGQWEPEDLIEQIRDRQRQLWLVTDGEDVLCALLTSVLADRMDTVHVSHCAGSGMHRWAQMFDVIEAWARELGAKRIEAVTRPGWERVLKGMGLEKTHVVLEKRL